MRKIFFIILFALILTVSGCSQEQPLDDANQSTPTTSQSATASGETAGNGITEESGTEGKTEIDDSTSQTDSTEISTPDETSASSSTETKVPSTTEKPDDKTPVTEDKKQENTTKPNTSDETDNSEETTSPVTETSSPDTNDTTDTEWTPKVYASARNAEEISTLVVKYINDYRAEQSVVSVTQLPGLTEYAEYRSVQLVSNYAHDTDDERAAATALKYGRYIDPSLYGISGEPYYTSEAREALAFTGKVGTVDEVANHIATMIRNSSGHWAYVGSGEYVYVGVGITYESGYWYCDIAMSKVNNG